MRRSARAEPLRGLGVQLIEGDITDAGAMLQGCAGADAAVHLAGMYRLGPIDEREMRRVNVDGTRTFLNAVAGAGVPRAVHVSTTIVLPPAVESTDLGECEPWSRDRLPTLYQRTKAEAHTLARAAQRRGAPVIIACPANIYGPRDDGPNGRFLRDLLRRRVPALVREPAWFSYVYVDDVAAGLALVTDHGRIGGCYLFGGEVESINGFAQRVARAAGVRPPRLRLPAAAIAASARLLDAFARATGSRFTISHESVRISSRERWVHDDAATREELHWWPRGLDRGILDMLDAEAKAKP